MCRAIEKNYIWFIIVSFFVIYIYSAEIDKFFVSLTNDYFYRLEFYIETKDFKYIFWLIFIASFGFPISLWEIKRNKRIKFIKNKRYQINKQREKEFKSDLFGYKKINKILAPKKVQKSRS